MFFSKFCECFLSKFCECFLSKFLLYVLPSNRNPVDTSASQLVLTRNTIQLYVRMAEFFYVVLKILM